MLAVVPMFHANAWGMPFTAAVSGARQAMPGPHLDAASLVDLMERERVSMAAGVPTIWLGILQYLDAYPTRHDLTPLRRMLVGGAAVPEALIRAFQDRHGLYIQQGWGMTNIGLALTASAFFHAIIGAVAWGLLIYTIFYERDSTQAALKPAEE